MYKNVPFDTNYDHTRWFTSLSDQANYFASLNPFRTESNVKYIRVEGGEVLITATPDSLRNVNYIDFVNEDKTYFAFVTSIEYGNQNMSVLKFEIDVIQTYMFEMNFKASFIEREHCKRWNSDGTPVVNTVPENLEIGTEYVTIFNEKHQHSIKNQSHKILLIATSDRLSDDTVGTNQNLMSGAPSSLFYYMFFLDYKTDFSGILPVSVNGTSMVNTFDTVLSYLQSEDNVNKVVGFTFLPFIPFENTVTNVVNTSLTVTSPYLTPIASGTLARVKGNVSMEQSLFIIQDAYAKLKNTQNITESKLLFYPYSYYSLIDNQGSQKIIKPEYLNNKLLHINGKGVIDVNYKFAYLIKGYKGDNDGNLEEALLTTVPTDIPVINDFTADYLQGNKNSMILNSVIGGVTGLATMGIGAGILATGGGAFLGGGMMASGLKNTFSSVGGTIAKMNDISNIPDNMANQGGSSVYNVANKLLIPQLLGKQISQEHINILENYFKTYGYAVHKTKIPNLRTRQRFNFVKTKGANIVGEIPKASLDRMIDAFDKGVTLWHTNDMFNFTSANNER